MGAMLGKASLGAILALAAAGTAQAAPSERLSSPALAGMVVGHTAANDAQSIKEDIPRGETVEDWSRMVTTQWFAGLATRATPAQFAENMRAGLMRGCRGATVTPVVALKVSGRTAIRFDADCPNNGRGQRESFMMLAVAGASDMHVKQVAFRGPRTAMDTAWAKSFLTDTVLCQPRDRQPRCAR